MNGKLQNRQLWLAGGALAALLIVAIGWLGLIKPSLDDASSIRDQAAAATDQNSRLAAANGKLAQKYPLVPEMQEQLARLLTAIPGTPSLPEFTREINARAKSMHVSLQSLAITAPAPVVSASSTASAPSDTQASAGSPAAPSPTTSAASDTTQQQIAITFTAAGPANALTSFVSAMQRGTRNLLVNGSSLSLDTNNATVNVQADIFTVPMTAAQVQQMRALLKSSR